MKLRQDILKIIFIPLVKKESDLQESADILKEYGFQVITGFDNLNRPRLLFRLNDHTITPLDVGEGLVIYNSGGSYSWTKIKESECLKLLENETC